jgi:hypothetical protein
MSSTLLTQSGAINLLVPAVNDDSIFRVVSSVDDAAPVVDAALSSENY